MTNNELWLGIGYADTLDEFVELEKTVKLIIGKPPEYRAAEKWAGDNSLIQIIANTITYQFLLGVLAERYAGKFFDHIEAAGVKIVRQSVQHLVKMLSSHAAHGGEVSFAMPLPSGNASRSFAIHLKKGDAEEIVQAAAAILKIAPEVEKFLGEHFDPALGSSLYTPYFRLDGAQLEIANDHGIFSLTVTLAADGTVTSEVRKTS